MRALTNGKAAASQATIREFESRRPLCKNRFRSKPPGRLSKQRRRFFVKNQNQKSQNRTLASKFVNNAFLDFMLSRQAMMCPQRTFCFYEYTLGKISDLLADRGVINHDLRITVSNFPNIKVFSSLAESKPTYI